MKTLIKIQLFNTYITKKTYLNNLYIYNMCKHVINSQVYIQSPCCKRWFECSECHDDFILNLGTEDKHKFQYDTNLKFTCKVCRKCFSRDFRLFSEKDKKCNYCETLWCLPADTPESRVYAESQIIFSSFLQSMVALDRDFYNTLDDSASFNNK